MHLVTSAFHILACIGVREARLQASQPASQTVRVPLQFYQFSCHLSEQGDASARPCCFRLPDDNLNMGGTSGIQDQVMASAFTPRSGGLCISRASAM